MRGRMLSRIPVARYSNLKANPECRVQVGRFRYRANARFLDGEARDIYWQKMVAFWPDFANYQKRTSRLIPVVQLVATIDADPMT